MYVNNEKNDRKRMEQALMVRESNSRHFGIRKARSLLKVLPELYYWTIMSLLLVCYYAAIVTAQCSIPSVTW